jgi:hypothetical protein
MKIVLISLNAEGGVNHETKNIHQTINGSGWGCRIAARMHAK